MFFNKGIVAGLVGGYVLGKVGDMVFGSEPAIKFYTKCATAGIILKDNTMEKVEIIQARAADIAADAREEADKYQAKMDGALDPSLDDDSEEDVIVEA